MGVRAIPVVLIAALLAFQVVRTAMVRHSPAGTAWWPGHPQPELNRIMAEIGAIAARGAEFPLTLVERVGRVAQQLPLAAEPFLIHGALAQIEGRDDKAERLYAEARRRDPRSAAARYFLTERYLRTGRVDQALGEMAILSRLTKSVGVFGPALADYARMPGAVPRLRRFFRTAPEFEPVVLSNLAADPKNSGLVLALWSGPDKSAAGTHSSWQSLLVAKLVEAGEYQRARATWRRFAGVGARAPGLFNPEFKKLPAPPPFNWTFGSAGGLAQPAGGGQLEVIYFGRDDALLAEQYLMLAPGRYVIGMDVRGAVEAGTGVAWSVECLSGKQMLLSLPVVRQPSGRLQADFTVPNGCPAQRLRLAGSQGDFPKAVEFTLGRLRLDRAGGR